MEKLEALGRTVLVRGDLSRIDEEVAKLRARVADGTFDSRSVVGDVVLRMEASSKQAREHLEEILEFLENL